MSPSGIRAYDEVGRAFKEIALIEGGYVILRRAVQAVETKQWADFKVILSKNNPHIIDTIIPCSSSGDYGLARAIYPDAFDAAS